MRTYDKRSVALQLSFGLSLSFLRGSRVPFGLGPPCSRKPSIKNKEEEEEEEEKREGLINGSPLLHQTEGEERVVVS